MGEYPKFLSRYYEQGCNNTNTVLGYWYWYCVVFLFLILFVLVFVTANFPTKKPPLGRDIGSPQSLTKGLRG